jgi:hypothetical protein
VRLRAAPAAPSRSLLRAVAAPVAACLVACSGRPPAEEAPKGPPAIVTPTPLATPLPTPTPTPVPPALACVSDADCTLTPYGHLVASAAACYCPTCPEPRNAGIAAANEESWQRLCGAAWAERAGCLAPMCARSPAIACSAGACGIAR